MGLFKFGQPRLAAGRRTAQGLRVSTLMLAGLLLGASSAGAQNLTLNEVIERALKFTPAMESASAQQQLGAANVDVARAPLLPNLEYDTEYYQAPGYSPIITNSGQSDTMLVLTYTAFDGGQRLARYRAARYASQAAAMGMAAARAQVVFDASLAYYNLLQTSQIETELKASLHRLDQYVTIVIALQRNGRAIVSDVLKIQNARNAAELSLVGARAARQRASVVLGALMGDFDQTDIGIADITAPPPPPGDDIERNPLLVAAQRRVNAAQQEVTAARAEAYPTFSLALTSGFLGVNPPHTVAHNLGASYDGLVTVPIFEGGLIRAHVNQAKARRMAALAQQHQIEIDLKQRLADARLRYQQASEELAMLAHALPTATNAFALYWTRFLGGGNTTLLEVLDAYNQAEQMKLSRIQQVFAQRLASIEGQLIVAQP
ncbi:MAG TPA: TolC family protein [Candidatus Binataceae bacterium]|nr:TolC family protein [Candidatus Binataceae bacterium]